MRLDRYKVKQRMNDIRLEHIIELATLADLHSNTIYNALDSHKWVSTTVEKIAKALQCNPLELITVDEDSNLISTTGSTLLTKR